MADSWASGVDGGASFAAGETKTVPCLTLQLVTQSVWMYRNAGLLSFFRPSAQHKSSRSIFNALLFVTKKKNGLCIFRDEFLTLIIPHFVTVCGFSAEIREMCFQTCSLRPLF